MIPGFRLPLLVGYLTGVIFLLKPWGHPQFRWICLPSLLNLIFIPIFCFINVDIIYHLHFHFHNATNTTFNSTADLSPSEPTNDTSLDRFEKPNYVDNLVLGGLYVQYTLTNMFIRVIFIWKGLKLADFLGRLKKYNKSKKLRWIDECSQLQKIPDFIITLVVVVTVLTVALLEGYSVIVSKKESTWLLALGNVPYLIVVVFLFSIPMMSPVQCAFCLIIVSVSNLAVIFEDYCSHVKELVTVNRKVGRSVVRSMGVDAFYGASPQNRIFFTVKSRQEILQRFQKVRATFALADEIIGPMALLVLMGASFAVVMKGYDLVVMSKQPVAFAQNVCHAVNFVCYFWILEVGQRAQDKINGCVRELEHLMVNFPEHTHQLERQTVKDVLTVVKQWNWKLTACDYFVIDRSLASGIVSSIMTYMVVLVQLKLSD